MKKLFFGLSLLLSVAAGANDFFTYQVIESTFPKALPPGTIIGLSRDMTQLNIYKNGKTLPIKCKKLILQDYLPNSPHISSALHCGEGEASTIVTLEYNNNALVYGNWARAGRIR